MSVETREFCDCCRAELRQRDGDVVYRRRIRRFRWAYFPSGRLETEWSVICGNCWSAIGEAVTRERSTDRDLPDSPVAGRLSAGGEGK